ncbi:Csr MutH archaeal HJR family nuclease [Tokyovirus A1]|uniref:Csr MutH archaeal HJR family nuclease n=1 Tax=Tokyovirus A1 TaxID=1826170 RepID=UPI0007A96D66|nr:Csr MutH archaeal HJR family nuclease [Tokyovirus A1]BAU80284.1 Csr MutH archaeal HJR family nuclease [Tokyovirus A1]
MDRYTEVLAEKGCVLLGEFKGEEERFAFRCKCGKEPCFAYPKHVVRKSWVGCSTCIKKAPKQRIVDFYQAQRRAREQQQNIHEHAQE